MNQSFRFKEFTVHQDQCAMKVGTDGVLLGAWTRLNFQPNTILDIGAGTGLIALMMAQRSAATTIDAVELDTQAYIQCVENFENSPWNDRLFCYHADFKFFAEETEDPYDLILSNPPFFDHQSSGQHPTSAREKARFNSTLPFETLLKGVAAILNPEGIFAFIIPTDKQNPVIALAQHYGLFPSRITQVSGKAGKPPKRTLIEMGFNKRTIKTDTLVIEISRHQYTPEYIALTRDFYLDR